MRDIIFGIEDDINQLKIQESIQDTKIESIQEDIMEIGETIDTIDPTP